MSDATTPPVGPLLEVTDLRTAFRTPRGLVQAVDGVSLSLARGATLGVVGESGSGKTVLSRSIMGLLGSRGVERSGSVRFEGIEIGDWSQRRLRSLWGADMSMVFQQPMTALNPVMKIGQQIVEGVRESRKISKAEARDLAESLLVETGIPEARRRLDEYPHQLSGGMRQRVVIAMALAGSPKLVFADEPTTALDVTVQAQILDLLQTEQTQRHMSMVLVTHDIGVAGGRTDEIIVMYAGQVVEQAPTEALLSRPRMRYTEALLRSVPRLDDAPHTRLAVIEGRPPDLVDLPDGCRFAPRCAYATEECRRATPPLVPSEGDPGHLFACWHPVEVAVAAPSGGAA